MKDPIAWRLLRCLYAAFYLLTGLQMALVLAGVLPPPDFQLSPESGAFQGALAKTGFVLPILAATFISSGVSLLFYRTAPLGIVLLAPAMVVIFFTDTLLDKAWIWGSLHAAILLVLAWHFRSAFGVLWSYGIKSREAASI